MACKLVPSQKHALGNVYALSGFVRYEGWDSWLARFGGIFNAVREVLCCMSMMIVPPSLALCQAAPGVRESSVKSDLPHRTSDLLP
jgi:hypothetical protein